MNQREHLAQEMDQAAEQMAAKIQALESRVVETKDEIQEKFSLEARVNEDPWKVLSVAIATGFVVGLVTS